MARVGGGLVRSVLAGVVLAVTLGGCELLMAGMYGDGFYEDFPSSSPIASYASGRATIRIAGGETIVLDRLAPGSGVDALFGSQVRWSGADGWSLQLVGAGGDSGGMFDPDSDGYLVFDRIVDGQHLTTFDVDRCIIDVEVADATALRGSATCRGLQWYDAVDRPMSLTSPSPVASAPISDAEVTFEAAGQEAVL